jgi:hypothetical protein
MIVLGGAADACSRRLEAMTAAVQVTASSAKYAGKPALEQVEQEPEAEEPVEHQCVGCSIIKRKEKFSYAQW